MKLVFVALGLLFSVGCAKTQPVALYMDTQDGGEAGHYVVILQKGSGTLKLFDCLARPNGEKWDPTCKETDLERD